MRLVLILLITFLHFGCNAQNKYSYSGLLIIENLKKPISLILELVEEKGIVSGYSITNAGEKDETKSEITGLYFKKEKSFHLTETQIISTNSEAEINTFCFINMQLEMKGKKKLDGTFTGNYLDSSECAKGSIILIETKKLEKKVKKIRKKVKQLDGIVLEVKQLKDGDNFSVEWESDYIKMFIWDANIEDGDRIEISINNKTILENYETKNKRKKIRYKIREGENIIEIKALNLGKSPPNTSRLELIDKKIKYPILTQLKQGKSAIIKIIK